METEKRHYYSDSQGLCIAVNHGHYAKGSDGTEYRTGEKHVQFNPVGNHSGAGGSEDKFGMFVTDDPEIIKFLDKRMLEVRDVYGPEEYNRKLMTHEQRESSSQRMIRELQEKNRLLEDMVKSGQAKAK